MIVEADEAEEAGDADGSGIDTGDAGNDTGDTDGPGNTEDCYLSATRHTSRSKNVSQGIKQIFPYND